MHPRDTHKQRLLRLRAAVLVAALASVLLVAQDAQLASAQNLESVIEKRERLEQELASATAAYENLQSDLANAEGELEALQSRVATLEARMSELAVRLSSRVRTAYKGGDTAFLEVVLSSHGPEGAIERAQLLRALNRRDTSELEGAENLRIQLDQAHVLLADATDELQSLEDQLDTERRRLISTLESTKDLEYELRTRQARQKEIQRGMQSGIYACIIERPYHYRDTWGAPRSGGRRHKGTDVMGQFRARVYAFTNGRISRMNSSGLGGIGLYLRGDDGHVYFYAHLDGYAASAFTGKRVEAGELIAYNGNTGNARGGVPHIHFEVHPGGGSPTNPYPWLTVVCPR